MNDTLQHILVLALVAGCLAWVLRGVVRTIRQKRGGVGSCCEKGCGTSSEKRSQDQANPRVVFVPVENLSKKRKVT